MGTLLQMCLGSVYAWSYFQKPLVDAGGWSHTQVAWTFSFAIGSLGAAAAVGGYCLPRFGPRAIALVGSLLYGFGYLLASLALSWRSLPLLWFGYGVVGGIGLGLGYVTPVATVAKWFPDRKGLVTGMVVMGFGFGALVMSKLVAPALEDFFRGHLPAVFSGVGLVVGGVGVFAASFMQNPGDCSAEFGGGPVPSARMEARGSICSREFVILWLVFFCNITAGIALIGFQSPLLQDLWRQADPSRSSAALAAAGATLIGVSSAFNGLGRLFWGGLSDRVGQLTVFRVMLATQILAFGGLMVTRNPWGFGALVCYVLLCYGGGFGVMPAFVSNVFGLPLMPVIYGLVLTAWSCAGVVGPQFIARLKDQSPGAISASAFGFCAGILALGLLFSLFLSPRSRIKK